MSLLAQPEAIVEVCAAAGYEEAITADTIPRNRAPPCRVRFDNFFTPGTAELGRSRRLLRCSYSVKFWFWSACSGASRASGLPHSFEAYKPSIYSNLGLNKMMSQRGETGGPGGLSCRVLRNWLMSFSTAQVDEVTGRKLSFLAQ